MKNTIYYIFNGVLVIMIFTLTFVKPHQNTISSNLTVKSLTTSELSGEKVFLRKDEKNIITNQEKNKVNNNVYNKDTTIKNDAEKKSDFNTDSVNSLLNNNLTLLEKSVSDNLVKGSVISDVLETLVGSMSSYGPDCVGCSGRLGGGYDARGGNYYYNDKKYGNIRIVAGDRKYPYGTIVRVVNSKQGTFNAIVLDRGGAIGIGRTFTFDLLCPSQSAAMGNGTSYNVKFEILRYGY